MLNLSGIFKRKNKLTQSIMLPLIKIFIFFYKDNKFVLTYLINTDLKYFLVLKVKDKVIIYLFKFKK